MLYSTTNTLVSICGIDPGSTNLGFANMVFDPTNMEIETIAAFTINLEKILSEDNIIATHHNERTAKIFALQSLLVNLFNQYLPITICCESPYQNRFRPNAYAPLVEVIYAARVASIHYNPAVRFQTYEPSIIKKSVGAGAISDKLAVKRAIMNNPNIVTKLLTPIDSLDEHSIDSIAVCYTHLSKISSELF